MNILRRAVLLALCGICCACGGSDTPAPTLNIGQVAGIWQLKSWTGEARNPDGTTYTFSDVIYVYVALNADNTYALYQNVGAAGAVKLTAVLARRRDHPRFLQHGTGSKAWSDSYLIGDLTDDAMTWTASHAAGDVQRFVRVGAVPQEVIDASAEVRSAIAATPCGIW